MGATGEITDELLSRFRCPECGERVHAVVDALECRNDHRVPWRRGYLDASRAIDDADTRRTAESFGYEWTAFDAIEPEDDEFWEVYFADLPRQSYAGKVALDAGCGKGRYSRLTAGHVRAMAALDNSGAVEAATRNLAPFANVTVVRGDLRVAPFADDSFEFICCLGVLHHLSDPEAGFRSLVRMLAPGGTLLVYVYSRPQGESVRAVGLAVAGALRRLTTRLPHKLLRLLSVPVSGAIYGAFVWPGALGARRGWPWLARLPLAGYRGKPLRSLWLDTFDRLSAPIERRYAWTDLEPWFRSAGLTVASVREQAGLFVVATGPPPVA